MVTYVSDDDMQAELARTRIYTLVILNPGPEYASPEAPAVIWEHGRRNFGLRADGLMNLVGPVPDDTDVCGIAVLATTPEEAVAVMDEDPAVAAGIFTYRLHPFKSFPGDALAG